MCMLRSWSGVWLLAISVFLLADSDRAQIQPGISTAVTCTSWNDISSDVQLCANVGYPKAASLNFRIPPQGSDEASRELNDYLPIINTRCSGALVHFLCSFYFPPCYNDPSLLQTHVLGPCNSMCNLVRLECASTFAGFGAPYPPFLNCSLPQFNPADGLCFGPDDPTTLSYPPAAGSGSSTSPTASKAYAATVVPGGASQILASTTLSPAVTTRLPVATAIAAVSTSSTQQNTATVQATATPLPPGPACYTPSEVPFCTNAGYESIYLPNALGDATPLQAERRLQSYKLFVEMNCSQALVHFLCYYYAPSCQATPPYALPPCRNLCEYVRTGCEPYFARVDMTWPPQFACESFPDVACYGPADPGSLRMPEVVDPSSPPPPTLKSSDASVSSCVAALAVNVSLLLLLFISRGI